MEHFNTKSNGRNEITVRKRLGSAVATTKKQNVGLKEANRSPTEINIFE